MELIACRFEENSGFFESNGLSEPQSSFPESRETSTQSIFEKGNEIALRIMPASVLLKDLDFDHTKIKCMNHLELIQSMGRIFIGEPAQDSIILMVDSGLKADLIQCFQESYIVARYFNCHYGLRYAIWKSGLAQHIPK